jgi:hypothetical protein
MSDRALHDRVIRYLTDAPARAAGPVSLPISEVDAARAGRFANFLARHYYRDRLARSFQYSYEYRAQTGRSAEQIADSAEFNSFLTSCVLGSLDSAQSVGEMARRHMLAAKQMAPWWASLIEYEYAYFLQGATSELPLRSPFPARGRSAVLKQFEWCMPEVLRRIRDFPLLPKPGRSGAPSNASSEPTNGSPENPTTIPSSAEPAGLEDLRRPVTLLFSRSREGKLFVVEVEDSVASVFNAVDGQRDIDTIASVAGVLPSTAHEVISALSSIGAIVVTPNR